MGVTEALFTIIVLVDLALTYVLWNQRQRERDRREISEADARFWERQCDEWKVLCLDMVPEDRRRSLASAMPREYAKWYAQRVKARQ